MGEGATKLEDYTFEVISTSFVSRRNIVKIWILLWGQGVTTPVNKIENDYAFIGRCKFEVCSETLFASKLSYERT